MNGYELSRAWFDFCFENPEKINPAHSAIYLFAIEHCNRLGWKEKFGFPSQMTMDALGIKKHQTYIKYFNDIVNWGFFKLIQKSKNQYSSNIISLNANTKKGKALDKAIIKHTAKQTESNSQSTRQSNGSIIKQINNKQLTIEHTLELIKIINNHISKLPITEKQNIFKIEIKEYSEQYDINLLKDFYNYWSEPTNDKKKIRKDLEKTWDTGRRLSTWFKNSSNGFRK